MALQGLDEVQKALKKQRKQTNLFLRGVYLQGLGNIATGTPIGEGRAANNWFLTTGSPFDGVTSTTSGNESFTFRMPVNVLGKRLFFTNNLPYINMLEYGGYGNGPKTLLGYSDQAVGGWVRRELLIMRNGIRNKIESGT